MFQKQGCTDTIIHVVWRQHHISTCEKEYWSSPPDGEEKGRDLWPATAHVSRVQAHLSDVVSVKQPAKEPFEPEAKPSMLASSKLPLVGVPVVGGRVQPLLLIGGQQLVHVVHPHAASHNLPNVGHQDVYCFPNVGHQDVHCFREPP